MKDMDSKPEEEVSEECTLLVPFTVSYSPGAS